MTAQEILAQGGLLSKAIPGYQERPQQLAMAALIEKCLYEERVGIVEAGTGVGKSFAYLVPIIERGGGAIISTANKTLQAQLMQKDLPFLHQALGGGFAYAVAKGKENYLCLLKARSFSDPVWADWIQETESGGLDEAPLVPTAEERRRLAADDGCLRKRCPCYGECFYYSALHERLYADIIVTNHALLCVQIANPAARILPHCLALVVDEAHQLEDYAINAFSSQVSSYAFRRGPAADFAKEGQSFLAELAEGRLDGQREDVLIEPTLEYDSGQALAERLREQAGLLPKNDDEEGWDSDGDDRDETVAMQRRADRRHLRDLADRVQVLASPTPPGAVRHIMRRSTALVAELTVFDVAERLSCLPDLFKTVIYTSATLATGRSLEHFRRRNGIAVPAKELIVGSPFDYERQALLYLPRRGKMPTPDWRNRDIFDAKARHATLLLVKASQGGALCLYTSHHAMREAAKHLAQETSYPVRCQGEMGKKALIEWLKTTPHAILCATASFWEGVDVPGDALRLVIIDKIPFAPQSPVQQARQAALGKRAFIDLSIPEAALALKQGFGRLIRTVTDRGVVAILDPRLWEKPYGALILSSLPPARQVDLVEEVERFYGAAQEQDLASGSPAEPTAWRWETEVENLIEEALQAPANGNDALRERLSLARAAQAQRDEARPADTHPRRRLFKTEDPDD